MLGCAHLAATPVSPARFFIERSLRKPAQRVNCFSVRGHRARRKQGAGWLGHKRHKFIREARHGAADTDPSNIGTTADACHPTTFADVALDDRPPAPQLYDALNIAVLCRKLSLLVVASAVTTFMQRLTEKPGRAKTVVERDHRRLPCGHMK